MLPATLAVLVVALGFAAWVGSRHHQREVKEEIDGLMHAASSDGGRAPSELDTLPAPVARYLRWALPEGSSIGLVRLQQVGTLRTDVRSERWMEFSAEHVAVPAVTGFVWNARVKIVPLVHVAVRDAFIAGQGSGRVMLLSALTVSADGGTPEMNSGSLHRFLAEAVWYPTALLPSAQLRWTAIDENRAQATLTNHGTSVSLEFRFAATGEVTGIYTPARWGRFDGGYQQRPWEGHFRNYQTRDGILVPMEGDVGWYVDNQWHPVWKGTITSFEAVASR